MSARMRIMVTPVICDSELERLAEKSKTKDVEGGIA
jgi:hypothetical protein